MRENQREHHHQCLVWQANSWFVVHHCCPVSVTSQNLRNIILSGIFGYSHFTGGFAGGQAEYIRVPYGDVNLLPIPDDVPDEKALFLSDVLGTSWHCVVDTGVSPGDVVAIWGAGPIGQMCAQFSFYHGAQRVILIDGGNAAWRLDYVKSKAPKIETIDYSRLSNGESVTSRLKELVPGGPDVALECAAGEYAKGWIHYFEQLLGMETDTSEILNEMITSVRPFGRVGVTGVYAAYVSKPSLQLAMQRSLTVSLTDESLQHWRTHADRGPIDRQWTSPRAEILGRVDGAHSQRGDQPSGYGDPQIAPRGHGQGVCLVRSPGRGSPESVCPDTVLGASVCRRACTDGIVAG